jgi:D-beta-D-heptose 7-phosphate kinase/D-beta-D-heptose 1-phosphate adenosyltransferase
METIPEFSSVRILVGGDAMLDEYWFGDASRISPEAPVPVVRASTVDRRAGGAANVALNVAALGAQTRFVAVIGDDTHGRTLAELLETSGVEADLVVSPGVPTIHKFRVLARNQQLLRLDAEGPLDAAAEKFDRALAARLGSIDIVILSDYGKGTLADVEALIAHCRKAGLPVLVDPKGTNFSRYAGATVLTPNQAEFEAVVGRWTDDAGLFAAGEQLRSDIGVDHLLVTRGSRGMTLISRESAPWSIAAEAREVFDVTGAGDTVIALLGAGIGAGLPMRDAVTLANLGAGLVVGKIGVASVTRAELGLALHRRGFGGRGLVTIDELVDIVTEVKTRGERIVMTNGCFDILHAGHVSYLEEAKSLGDHLIVAVNDDASVTRLKGPPRPITPLADRMAVLAGLAAVDWVVPFAGDTPEDVVRRVLPDVLVKGGDWRIDQIAGADTVLAAGGVVRSLAFKPGCSTTALIESIRERSGA